MKLILHIGTEKTGTTSAQRWFAKNREELQGHGLLYPASLGQPSHRLLSVAAMDPAKPDDAPQWSHIGSPAEHEKFREDLQERFHSELQSVPNVHTVLISSEHLHSRLINQESVSSVAEFFHDNFNDIIVYVAIRPQIDLAVSLMSTKARLGHRLDARYFEVLDEEGFYYNYDRLIAAWETAFGTDQVCILPFKRTPDFRAYLVEKLGIREESLQTAERMNESLDWRTMVLTNALTGPAGTVGDYRARLPLRFIDGLPRDEGLKIGEALGRRAHQRFMVSNANLAARRKDITETDLTPDWDRYSDPSNIEDVEAASHFAGQLGHLICFYKSERLVAQVQRLFAEARLANACSQPLVVANALQRAKKAIAELSALPFGAEQAAELRGQLEELGPPEKPTKT